MTSPYSQRQAFPDLPSYTVIRPSAASPAIRIIVAIARAIASEAKFVIMDEPTTSLTQKEVDNLIAMYQTPGGQTLLNKMPVVMQNTMTEMQDLMRPMMQRIQKMQQDVVSEIQAEKTKKSG